MQDTQSLSIQIVFVSNIKSIKYPTIVEHGWFGLSRSNLIQREIVESLIRHQLGSHIKNFKYSPSKGSISSSDISRL
jgi:hypothetical protein